MCALQTGYANFVKGAEARDRMGAIFGGGILISDGHAWKRMRKMVVGVFGLPR